MIELNKCYNEGAEEFLAKLPDNFVDLTLCSPPYSKLRSYNGFTLDFEVIAKQLFRITKTGGVVVWVVNDQTTKGSESGTSFKQALYFKDCGFNLHDTMLYAKENYIPLTHNRYEQQFEYMFCFSKGKPKTFNPIMRDNKYAGNKRSGGGFRHNGHDITEKHTTGIIADQSIHSNIFYYTVGFNQTSKDKITFKHSAAFPEKLAEDQIISWTNPQELVLDCFAGSGTTLKMAKLNNRDYLGCEISSEYCEIVEERLKLADKEKND